MKQVSSKNNNLKIYISGNLNPYENLALEKFLLENVLPGQVFLYLWQNEKTVVCGRNQNVWKECRTEKLLKDNGYIARRLSGGGAVFHDLGNLNFTFTACDENYNLDRQLDVIISAVRSFGIEAEKTGRNDIAAYGGKFSGNAFYAANPRLFEDKQTRRCHHGTLMVDVDRNIMGEYLNADKEKYTSKGVDSVKSRVCNLKDFNSEVDIKAMKLAMINAFEEIYGQQAEIFYYGKNAGENAADIWIPDEVEKKKIEENTLFFSSEQWIYKNNIKFNVRFYHRFDFGDFDLRLYVEKGIVKQTALYSDAMDERWILNMADKLKTLEGKAYSPDMIRKAIDNDAISEIIL